MLHITQHLQKVSRAMSGSLSCSHADLSNSDLGYESLYTACLCHYFLSAYEQNFLISGTNWQDPEWTASDNIEQNS